MPVSESQMKAKNKWARTHVKQVKLEFFDTNARDISIYDHICIYSSKQAYIKNLIEADMAKKEKLEKEKTDN